MDQRMCLSYDYTIIDQLPEMNPPTSKSKHHTYSMVSRVGNGNFGEVYLVQSNIDANRYVIKKIRLQNRGKESKEQILKEIKLMQQLNHCYVVRYIESFVKEKSVCIVMEYAENGDLEKYLERRKTENRPLSEEQVIEWFIQLLLGLKYIHEKKIVHRDLKPDNIFISSDNELKIGDFGISKLMSQTLDLAKTKIGTPFIMAPEIWENMKYNQKSDIWSLGCVLYKLMTFKYPFQADNSGALMVKVLSHKIPPITGNYTQELKSIALQMLQFEAQKRPSVQKILENPFIKKYFCKTLQKTINLYDQNNSSNQGLKKSSSINRLFKKRSSSSLSTSVKGTSMGSSQYLKIIQYKQNYPMIMEENRVLKEQLNNMKQDKEKLENKTQELLQQMRDNAELSREQLIWQFQQHVLNYLYP